MNKIVIGLIMLIVIISGCGSGDVTSNVIKDVNIDKCEVPAGVDEESWKEHMSHHPEMYRECL